MALIGAWVIFWLNTALFPCCEVVAAIWGGHTDNGSQSATVASPLHHSGAASFERVDQGSGTPCSDTLISGPPIAGEHEALASDRSSQEWFAIDARAAAIFPGAIHSANLALARDAPQPPLRLYLRTQRLRI